MVIPRSLKPFEELTASGFEYFRLEHFGGIKLNTYDESNSQIQCFFTPLENQKSINEDCIRLFKDQIQADIGVGYLPVLLLGEIYRGSGAVCHHKPWPQEKISFNIDLDHPESVKDASLEGLPPELKLKSSLVLRSFSSANQAGIKILFGQISNTSNDKSPEKKASSESPLPFIVLVPEAELIRFYYATSEKLSKAIFSGRFNTSNWQGNFFNSIHESPSFDQNTGKGRFVYRHGYTDVDIPILARILFDSTKIALRGVQKICNSWHVQSINRPEDNIFYPKTDFPFRGKTIMRLSGSRWRTNEDKDGKRNYVFIVNRIISCSGSFPFKALSYCDEIESGGESAEDEAPTFEWQQRFERSPDHAKNGDIGTSKTNEKPSRYAEKILVSLSTRHFTALDNTPLTREKLRDNTYRPDENACPPIVRNDLINASTGDGTQGETTSTPQVIRDRSLPTSPVSVSLENFVLALRAIAKLQPEWKIETRSLFKRALEILCHSGSM